MKTSTLAEKQQAIQMSADRRDLIMSNWNYMKKSPSFNLGNPAQCLKYAIDWYSRVCVTDDYIIVPVHVMSFIEENSGECRAINPNLKKDLKCLDLNDLEEIRRLWGTLPRVRFVSQIGPHMGRGIDLQTWVTYDYIAFSIWLYCYECNGFGPYYVYDFDKFGKTMHTGFNFVRWQEIAYDRKTHQSLHVFGCTRYYIGEGKGEGDTPSTLSRFKELFMEQGQEYGMSDIVYVDQTEQQMDDYEYDEHTGPEIGG